MRLLLLQIRNLPSVREEEYQSFLRYCRLVPEQLDVLNVFDTPRFGPEAINGYDALLVGGASEASVLEPENYPAVPHCISLLQHCIAIKLPVFASCFGFQLAVLALGGEIVRDEEDFEMGTLPISLRPAAAQDTLLRDVPDGFHAVAVHRERAPVCPEGAIELAYTANCCHAFRLPGRPFWAFQFHPEVDRATLVDRLTTYAAAYTRGDAHLGSVLENAVETPESNALMGKFIDRVLGREAAA
ncbi:MAG: type 1 glutamine amidotransferase [Halieaceae bacterium]|jgi:GMP synthase (glutamine-hydrolysing)|nr:type 1 glutamine amidotransferase [Halieaceae bacterium]